VQTFLPYSDFLASARTLDRMRLGKQRVEALQIIKALVVPAGARSGWANHPAVRMWAGHEGALLRYLRAVCAAWRERGYRDTCEEKGAALLTGLDVPSSDPTWLGDERMHASHRSNLLRKSAQHYGSLGWVEGPDLPYFWPTKDGP
jgi:hypothetical protein